MSRSNVGTSTLNNKNSHNNLLAGQPLIWTEWLIMFAMFWTFVGRFQSLAATLAVKHFRTSYNIESLSYFVWTVAITLSNLIKQTHNNTMLSFHKPLDESSSMGCLNAVMSLNVHRKSTTLSCSLRMGAIFTKNHTGIPVQEKEGEIWWAPS